MSDTDEIVRVWWQPFRCDLAEFLRTHSFVEAIRPEAEDRGGTAVTIVDLGG